MNKFLIYLTGYFLIVGAVSLDGLQNHRQSLSTEKLIAYNTIKRASVYADTLVPVTSDCPSVDAKYVEKAKEMVMNEFKEPDNQEYITKLGFDTVISNDLSLITDPQRCEGIKGYMQKWLRPTPIFTKVFLKISGYDYSLIVFVPNSLSGLGRWPIHLMTADFEPKAIWLY